MNRALAVATAACLALLWELATPVPLQATPAARDRDAPVKDRGAAASRPSAGASPHRAEAARRARAQAHFAEGKKRFDLRQFEGALASFKKAYEILPLSGFLFNIGQCHRFMKDCDKANLYYQGFVRENPGTPDAAFVKKLIARCEHRLARSKARREKADQLFVEAKKSFTLQQYPEALALFEKAYRAHPRPGYLYHLAETHLELGNHDKSVHFYRAYMRENPGSPREQVVVKRIAEAKRRQEKARKARAAGRIQKNLGLGKGQPGGAGPRPTPLYKRWWLWTAIGAVAAAAAVGFGLGFGARDGGLPGHSDLANFQEQ